MSISNNLKTIRNDIGPATQLVAVSKQQPMERVEKALAAGQRIFGENRVQEAAEKWPPLREAYPDIELHMIGPLQSNKAADAVALFDVIQTLDRKKIIDSCAEAQNHQSRTLSYYIQVNTGQEAQKSGVEPDNLGDILKYAQSAGLNAIGLMCIPPIDEAPGLHFALLRKLAVKHGLHHLSMGMSSDYKTAVKFGATSVRIGSAIFGARI